MKEDRAALTVADLAGLNTVTVEEAAAMLGFTRNWAYRKINEGSFPAKTIRVGNRVRVVAESLARLLSAED